MCTHGIDVLLLSLYNCIGFDRMVKKRAGTIARKHMRITAFSQIMRSAVFREITYSYRMPSVFTAQLRASSLIEKQNEKIFAVSL
jgi:hypothetical protein